MTFSATFELVSVYFIFIFSFIFKILIMFISKKLCIFFFVYTRTLNKTKYNLYFFLLFCFQIVMLVGIVILDAGQQADARAEERVPNRVPRKERKKRLARRRTRNARKVR